MFKRPSPTFPGLASREVCRQVSTERFDGALKFTSVLSPSWSPSTTKDGRLTIDNLHFVITGFSMLCSLCYFFFLNYYISSQSTQSFSSKTLSQFLSQLSLKQIQKMKNSLFNGLPHYKGTQDNKTGRRLPKVSKALELKRLKFRITLGANKNQLSLSYIPQCRHSYVHNYSTVFEHQGCGRSG